ncbi:hypothetical protein EI77_02679 [Prosthecobacter fusiformis]|uniref:Hydrogenase nickel incorporation protein HypA n=1 Tax=Prosthecobacter fusiformis TaxID=48464 RepID=A0A4R7RXU6_9BACT|nr:hypothetical protein [Prosthecobacter fusiformis]TDU70631.1 hypothetical protein EI77_02679 [Prosthecobacter fusiformis]
MIGIGLAQLIMLVMLIGVSSVCSLWFYTFWRERRREVKRRRIAILCRICGCTYAIPHKSPHITVCPSCGSKNERGGLPPI